MYEKKEEDNLKCLRDDFEEVFSMKDYILNMRIDLLSVKEV